MVSRTSKVRYQWGFSLIDAMVAVVILLIAVIGTSIFRYNAVLDGRRFNSQTSGARIALMFSESWQGINGDLTFNPTALSTSELTIKENAESLIAKPSDFTLLGSYMIKLNDVHDVTYHANLSWKDIQSGLRALNVVIGWAQRSAGENEDENVDKSFRLTVYTRTL